VRFIGSRGSPLGQLREFHRVSSVLFFFGHGRRGLQKRAEKGLPQLGGQA
jgi:hypothetical protein